MASIEVFVEAQNGVDNSTYVVFLKRREKDWSALSSLSISVPAEFADHVPVMLEPEFRSPSLPSHLGLSRVATQARDGALPRGAGPARDLRGRGLRGAAGQRGTASAVQCRPVPCIAWSLSDLARLGRPRCSTRAT